MRSPWLLLPLAALALDLGLALRDGDPASVLLGALGVVLALLLLLLAWVLVARVWTSESAVHRRGLLGRTRVVHRDAVASVL